MSRKIKVLAAYVGFIAAGVILPDLAVKAACYILLFIFTL